MLGITMRVMRHVYPGSNVEERDALAREWPYFLRKALPHEYLLYLPNIGAEVTALAAGVGLDGLIFSGGEDWGVVPERDDTEAALFAWAQARKLPIFGVCRGAQVINRLLGGTLELCPGHAGTRHLVHLTRTVAAKQRHEVNSFHGQGIAPGDLAPGLDALAAAPDGTVEAFTSADGRIAAVMWHPEREPQAAPLDVALLRAWRARGSAPGKTAGDRKS